MKEILAASPAMVVFSAEGHEGTVKGFIKRFRRNTDGSGYAEF